MFLEISSIVFLLIELVLIFIFIILSYKSKTVLSKSTTWYFVPLFFLNIGIYTIGYCYYAESGIHNVEGYNFFTLTQCISASLNAFKFEVNYDFIAQAANDNIYFRISVIISTLMSGFTLIATVLSFFRITIINAVNTHIKKNNNADIIISYNQNSKKYVKQNKNSILWIDSSKYKLTRDEKIALYNEGITYFYRSLSTSSLKSILRSRSETMHFIVFANDNEKINYTNLMNVFTDQEIETNITVFLHIEAKNEYINFVNTQMSNLARNSKYDLIATCFNIHELIARRFVLNNTYLDYLPKDYMENGLLKKDINVFFLGFGKTNFSIFKSCVLNNHFVTEKNGKLYNKPVNYYLYDSFENKFHNNLLTRLKMDYFEPIKDNKIPSLEKICNVEFEEEDIKTEKFLKEIKQKMNKDNYNIIFVSFSDTIENASFAELLEHNFGHLNIHIYYNIDDKFEIISNDFSKKITPYGFKEEILDHHIIANDSLANMAREINKKYFGLNNEALSKWNKLPVVEKYSNIYSAINVKFKLQMMNLKYEDLKSKNISQSEYYKILFENKNKKEMSSLMNFENYNDYFDINLRNIIAFEEHLRWNAFYYINDFNQMSSKDIYFESGKVFTKNLDAKKHACLTTFYGLDILHNEIIQTYKKSGIDKTIQDIEVYKYDYMVIDNLYDSIAR